MVDYIKKTYGDTTYKLSSINFLERNALLINLITFNINHKFT